MNAVRYPTPGEREDVVKVMDPAELEKAIAHSSALIEAHKKSRPAHTDIPALTIWAQDMDVLRTGLQMLVTQRAIGWKDVPMPTGPVPQPPPSEPDPIPTPIPKEETAVKPSEKLTHKVNLYNQALAKANASPSDVQLRKNVMTARNRVKNMAASYHLAEPELEPLPPAPMGRKPHVMPPALEGRAKHDLGPLPPTPPFCRPEPLTEKAGPGPYKEPTAEDLRALLPPRTTERLWPCPWSPGLPLRSPCGEDCIHPDNHHNDHAELVQGLAQLLESQGALPSWMRQVQDELARARAKFPAAEHRTLALAEEAGEVVKAVLDLRAGTGTLEALHAEIIQTMAMCVRLLEEGDPSVLGTL